MAEVFDRLVALREFDQTKAGVKGLVDSGATALPPIFRYPNLPPPAAPRRGISIPTVDLSLSRPAAASLVRAAASDWGFFHVTNHGIPLPAISAAVSAVRAFNELPAAERSLHYTRSVNGGVNYSSNVDLFKSKAASWRDTVQIGMGPVRADPDRIPAVCREELLAWDGHATAVVRRLLGLLSEGLGVDPGRLEELSCHEGRLMACHYYPPCPEPDLTMGLTDHTDPGVLTVVVQDKVGGLQVKRRGEDDEAFWVDVEPVPGALVINIGDLLQIISNDKYKSVEHRVVANAHQEARVSVAVFFNPGKREESDLYGPLPELVSPENPPHYQNFTFTEFMTYFFSKGLASKSLTEHFKLKSE